MTTDEALTEMWRELRNDRRSTGFVRACINFAYDIEAMTLEQRELWLRRILTCPGHDDEGGRSWCGYCGDMPLEAGA